MLYTNGTYIIEKENDVQTLQDSVKRLERQLQEDKGLVCEFELSEELGVPAYLIPEGVSYSNIQDVIRHNIEFKSFDEDEFKLPESKTINIKYTFTVDEKLDMSLNQSDILVKIQELEEEKKIAAADFKAQIDDLKAKISISSSSIRMGYEMRDVEALVVLSRKDQKKVFYSAEDGETILKTEDLNRVDYEHYLDLDAQRQIAYQTSLLTDESETKDPEEKFLEEFDPVDKEDLETLVKIEKVFLFDKTNKTQREITEEDDVESLGSSDNYLFGSEKEEEDQIPI